MSLSKELPDFVLSEKSFFYVADQELKCFPVGVKRKTNDFKEVANSVLEAMDSPYFFDWTDTSEAAQKEIDNFRVRFGRARVKMLTNITSKKADKFDGMGAKVFISKKLYQKLLKPKEPQTFLASDNECDSDYIESDEEKNDVEAESLDFPDQDESQAGRPEKDFKDCSTRRQKAKTDECMEFFEETCEHLKLDFYELLSYFGMRHAYENGDFQKGNFFKTWFKEGVKVQMEETKLSLEKAIYLKEQLRLSRNKYVELREMFEGKTIIMPTKHAIKDYLDDYVKPKLEQKMDGVKGKFSDLLERTVLRRLKGVGFEYNYQRLTVKVACGFDGSGSHKQKGGRTLKKGINTKNKVLGGFRIATIHDHYGNLLFKEKSQGAHSLRPWFILNCNESRENVEKIAKFFEEEILEVIDNPFTIKWGDDSINTKVKAGLFMDSKLINLVTGLGGKMMCFLLLFVS